MKIKLVFLSSIINLFLSNVVVAQLSRVVYFDGEQKLNGLIGIPDKPTKTKAGVLILPAWMGIDPNSKKAAASLNELGYFTFVADIYGEGNYPTDTKTAAARSAYFKGNVDLYRKRIKLALDQLIKSGADSANIVVIGYCFGGTGALEAARANMPVKGVVSFHGGLARDTAKIFDKIIPKILVCHGANDFFITEQQIKLFQDEMRKTHADWQMVYYADAVHAFTDKDAGDDPKKGIAYNEKADKRSWQLMLLFFNELFQ